MGGETVARQVKRLRSQLEAQRADSEIKLADAEHRFALERGKRLVTQQELDREKLDRVGAQRALLHTYPYPIQRLCAWLEETPEATSVMVVAKLAALHLWKRKVVYDPDADQAVLAEVAAGRIPPPAQSEDPLK